MRRLRELLRAFHLGRLTGDAGREVREEIDFHLEERARELEGEEGLAPAEARAEARRRFGHRDRIERRARVWAESTRRRRELGGRVEGVIRDVRYAGRGFVRSPAFTLLALVTLALGIGATTGIFSLAEAVFLRAPPVEAPERLAMVYTTCRDGDPRCGSSYPDFRSYRERSTRFADIAAYSWVPMSVGVGDAGARLATGQVVSGNYFDLLGVRPAAGRLLRPSDDVAGGAAAVLSHDFWVDVTGGDPAVVGTTVRINGTPFTVVGVAREGFRGLDVGGDVDAWIPLRAGSLLGESAGAVAREGILGSRRSRWIAALVGRLAPGATAEQARREMASISSALRRMDPEARGPRSITVDAAGRYALPVFDRGELVRFVGVLGGVVAFALLLATANLANLLLARGSARRREMGVRRALGAGRARLVRQLVTESLLLAGAGGAAGLVVARWLVDLLSGFTLPGLVPVEGLHAGIDGRVLAFAAAVSVVTGLAFGLLPALRSADPDVVAAMRGESRGAAPGRIALRKGLVVVQVAISLVLLVGSGLFLRTLRSALAFDPGFRTENVALIRYNPGFARYAAAESYDLLRRVEERLRGLPGVEDASTATLVPLQVGGHRGTFVDVDGYEAGPDEEMRVEYVGVRPGYFRTLGIPLLSGRGFTSGDDAGATEVAVVSETAARRWWPDGDAVGGRIRFAGAWFRVVGVAGDVRWRALEEEPGPFLFVSIDQFPAQTVGSFLTVAARTSADAGAALPTIRTAFASVEPDVALTSVTTMGRQVEEALAPQRLGAILLTALGALALILAAVGIYGVVSYAVSRRLREVGIRLALGAGRREVVAGLVGEMAVPVGLGLVVGLGAALALSGLVRGFVFGVASADPITYAAITVGLAAVAAVATLVPARRATRIDPVRILTVE